MIYSFIEEYGTEDARIRCLNYLDCNKPYPQIGTTVSHQFELPDAEKSATVSHQFVTDPERLISNLSFSHIREIMVLKDPFERFFYETECINCNWSIRELRTLYAEDHADEENQKKKTTKDR